MQCATHPSVETELACGRCGKAICPRCLYHTPVGARCRQCAGIRRLPTYNISPAYLARGAGAAIVSGAALGALWGFLLPFGPSFFFGLLLGLGLGYGVASAVSAATNRKAGVPIQAMGVLGVIVAYLVRCALVPLRFDNVQFVELLTEDFFGYLTVAFGAFVAWSRLR